MEKLYLLLVLAITMNAALGMSFRHKRQSTDDDDNNLDDRYGGDRPGFQNQWQNGGPQWNNNRPQFQQQWNNNRPPFQPQWNNNRPWDSDNQNQWGNDNENQWGNDNQNQQRPRPTPGPTTTPAPNGSTTQSSAVQACITACPVTPEYNPVCGTNLVQYPNPGRLLCAQQCGVNVSLLRASNCPVTTTAAPAS